jgi:predicted secreted protein
MQFWSIVAIYFLVWIFVAFVMLPFGVRTHEELGEELIPGQAESAPANFRPGRLILRAAVIAAVLTAIWVLNWENGWITRSTFDFMLPPSQRS